MDLSVILNSEKKHTAGVTSMAPDHISIFFLEFDL